MTKIIDLVFSNDNIYLWNAEDWATLRKDYRIIGEFVGCLPKHPRQHILNGLPMLLLPEEAKLLLDEGIARLVQYPCLEKESNQTLKNVFLEYRDKLYEEQKECLKEHRKKQITTMMDKIVDGKKRKILGLETSKKKLRKPLDQDSKNAVDKIDINREALLKEELAKLPKLDKNDALVQNHTVYPWLKESDIKIVNWDYPITDEQKLRYAIFRDLWNLGYYVTSGEKFGGDFLIYPGDPILFHSQFIIQCQDRNEKISPSDLISQGRIGCHVRKTQVFATWSEDGTYINYQSFQWAESNTVKF